MSTGKSVVVVGAGIIGLSSALAISEALPDAKITIIADKFLTETTSMNAFGLWEPYFLGNTPEADIKSWGSRTLEYMSALAHSPEGPLAGTITFHGYSIYRFPQRDQPMWGDMVTYIRRMTRQELERYGSQYVDGWAWRSAATEGKFYLPWITQKLKDRGVTLIRRKLKRLDELAGVYNIIVNCTGLGSFDLLDDKEMVPVQGQVMRVSAPWVREFINSDDDDIYILPGRDSVVLGGTHVEGAWDTTVDADTKEWIRWKCTRVLPSLTEAEWMADWVGLRPMRSRVRLEVEDIPTGVGQTMKVVHNYGHGGAGITLFWGCALDAAALVQKELTSSKL